MPDDEQLGEVADVLIRWSVTLVEPLIRPARRRAAEDDLESAHGARPDVVRLWFAGVTSDVARSLPAADPWRSLVLPNDPSEPVRWPDGRRFGSWQDGLDTADPVLGDPALDPETVALVDSLSVVAGRVLVAAFAGWERALAEAERAALSELVDTLRWAVWRRRQQSRRLAAGEDAWALESAHTWALRISRDLEIDPAEIEIEVRRNTL